MCNLLATRDVQETRGNLIWRRNARVMAVDNTISWQYPCERQHGSLAREKPAYHPVPPLFGLEDMVNDNRMGCRDYKMS